MLFPWRWMLPQRWQGWKSQGRRWRPEDESGKEAASLCAWLKRSPMDGRGVFCVAVRRHLDQGTSETLTYIRSG